MSSQSEDRIDVVTNFETVGTPALGQAQEQVEQLGTTAQAAGARTVELGTAAAQSGARVAAAGQATSVAAVSFGSMATRGQEVTQKVQGMTGAVQALVSATGSSSRTAGLISSMAGATAQMAAMGSMLGPAGTVVGGVVGFATSLASLASSHEAARDAAREQLEEERLLAEQADETEAGIRNLADAIRDRAAASRLSMGVASELEYAEAIDSTRARIDELRARYRELQGEMYENRDGDEAMLAALASQRDSIAQSIGSLESLIDSYGRLSEAATAESVAIMGEDLNEAANPRRSGSSGPSPADEAIARERAAQAEVERRLAEEDAAKREQLEALADFEKEMRLERQAELDAEAERDFERQAELNQMLADLENEHQDRILEGRRAMKEAELEQEQMALAQREEAYGELMGFVQGASKAMFSAIGEVITGNKSGEEAFKGFLAAALEMISEYTTLKAGVEFAEAGGALARYDYGGFAAHTAAGVAFTAVAAATGIGAAAINQPPSAAPARPETAAAAIPANVGDTIVMFNSPVITAGTYADLGREVSYMAAAGGSI